MSRCSLVLLVAFCWLHPAAGQEQIIGQPPERIDLTPPPPEAKPTVDRSCLRKQEAAIISGEIVVCGERDRGRSDDPGYSRDRAEDRYAARTRNEGTLPTPDVAGEGIFRGPATVSGVCVPGVFNCPKPPALIIDVTALPKAPPGSDADRIGRGLAPLGSGNPANDGPAPTPAEQRENLGLPDAAQSGPGPGSDVERGSVSPEESEEPEEPR